jgi:hypothetical protein
VIKQIDTTCFKYLLVYIFKDEEKKKKNNNTVQTYFEMKEEECGLC